MMPLNSSWRYIAMSNYRSKAIEDLSRAENELTALVDELAKTASRSTAKKIIVNAKNIAGKAISGMPTSEAYLAPLKKKITPILNTLAGLEEGIKSDDMDRSTFKQVVNNLKSKFIPQFREALDGVLKKARATNTRFNEDGLLQEDSTILEELEKVVNDFKRLVKMLSSAKDGQFDASQMLVLLGNRADLALATYGSLPEGKDLDNAADALAKLAELTQNIIDKVKRTSSVPLDMLRKITGHLTDLERDIAAINKKVMNNLLSYDDKPRKPLNYKVPKTAAAKPQVKKDNEDGPRSPDAFLKERIADVKSELANMPKSLKGPYDFIRAPVVAIFDSHDDIARRDRPVGSGTVTHNFSKQKLLDQFGIKYIQIEDYLVLKNQTLLAVDKPKLEQFARTQLGKRAGSNLKDDVLVEFARQMLDMVNDRSSQHYVMVSREFTANPRNTNMILFWVMPSRILNTLIARGWNKLSSWSLPFDID